MLWADAYGVERLGIDGNESQPQIHDWQKESDPCSGTSTASLS
jgi:hypothetical protein